MKWYETPIEDLYERALLALARNDEDTYKESHTSRQSKKIKAEMDRRTRVYGLGAGYWK